MVIGDLGPHIVADYLELAAPTERLRVLVMVSEYGRSAEYTVVRFGQIYYRNQNSIVHSSAGHGKCEIR